MREEVWWAVEPGPAAGGDGVAEVLGIPVDDDGGEQVETRHTVMLPPMGREQLKRLKELEKENQHLRGAVSNLTLDKQILTEAARGNY